jgi:diguanylate cyclase (GGDEF)-like protein
MALRILIAEEEPAVRDHIVRVLDGHHLVAATSGQEALASLGGDPFSLVVTGLEVGELSGLTLLEEARARQPEALVVVTIDPARAAESGRVLRSGAHDCVMNSCDETDVLTAALQRAIRHVTLAKENQALLCSLKRNVEALGRQNRQLEELATRDGLTGLYNHRYFREAFDVELSRCSRYSRKLSLVFADVDHFKNYNDTHGHLAGDRLLSQLGQLLTEDARKSTIMARYGGEEFVLLVPETDHSGALVYAEKIRSRVKAHAFGDGGPGAGARITLSAGVATFPDHGTDADTLIKYADDALYRAKRAGRNTVCG